MTSSEKSPPRTEVWKMFDRISRRYDLLNRLLSLWQDTIWRKKVGKRLKSSGCVEILDCATGTADIILTACRVNPAMKRACGIDMAQKMLEIGRKKAESSPFSRIIDLVPGDAMEIPFRSGKFDAVTISFGIRNVLDVEHALGEMRRILKPGGKAFILEFSLPSNFLIKKLYLFYFRYVLPLLGSIISGDSYAYRYLNKTVETFPYGSDFCGLMTSAGFKNCRFTPLTFGIASIYEGEK